MDRYATQVGILILAAPPRRNRIPSKMIARNNSNVEMNFNFLDRLVIPDTNPELLVLEQSVRARFNISEPDWPAQWRTVVDSINQIGRQLNYEHVLRERVRVEAARQEGAARQQ